MRVLAIDHLNLRASKALIAELRDFYHHVLGLRVGWRPPFRSHGHWLYLEDQPIIHLVEDESIDAPTGARGKHVDHVAFSCTDLQGFEKLLTDRGIPFRRTEVPGTPLVQLFFADPAGNGVELQFASSAA
jgi:catechol 2,3-dioxygenase-like lactoylglutathione lyase family enzyme